MMQPLTSLESISTNNHTHNTNKKAKFQPRKNLEQCEDLEETHLTKKYVPTSKSEKDKNFELQEQV